MSLASEYASRLRDAEAATRTTRAARPGPIELAFVSGGTLRVEVTDDGKPVLTIRNLETGAHPATATDKLVEFAKAIIATFSDERQPPAG